MDKLFRNDDLEDNRFLEEEEVKDDDGDLCFIPEPDILDDTDSDILNSDRMLYRADTENKYSYNFIHRSSLCYFNQESGIIRKIVQKVRHQQHQHNIKSVKNILFRWGDDNGYFIVG